MGEFERNIQSCKQQGMEYFADHESGRIYLKGEDGAWFLAFDESQEFDPEFEI